MKVLVTGATGNQGRRVIYHTLRSGHEVYGMVRDLESDKAKEIAKEGVILKYGDLDNEESVFNAMKGMDTVFSVQNFWRVGNTQEFFQARNTVNAAKRNNVKYYIHSSAGMDTGCGSTNVEVKSIIEAIVRESFPNAFILRPVWFMEGFNPTSFDLSAKTFDFVTSPLQNHVWVSLDDIGKIVSRSLDDFELYSGLTINFASSANTGRQMAAVFAKAFNIPFTYRQLDEDIIREKVRSWFSDTLYINELDSIFSFIRFKNFTINWDQINRLLPDRHSLDSWVEYYAFPNWRESIQIK